VHERFDHVWKDEEHPLRLVGRKLADVAEGVDMTGRQHEEVRLGPRRDVTDRDKPIRGVNVVALDDEPAEEAVVRQRGSPPP